MFQDLKQDPENKFSGGNVADYIPPLAIANPNIFSACFSSIHYQTVVQGDKD